MSAPRYARAAAALLARAAERELPPPGAESRERAIHALEVAIGRRSRNRRRARYAAVLGGVASVAAAAVLYAGFWPHRAPLAASPTSSNEAPSASATSARTTSEAVVVVAHPMGAGASVVASGGPTRLGDGVTLGEGESHRCRREWPRSPFALHRHEADPGRARQSDHRQRSGDRALRTLGWLAASGGRQARCRPKVRHSHA